jgi:hypothetical protein
LLWAISHPDLCALDGLYEGPCAHIPDVDVVPCCGTEEWIGEPEGTG